MAKQFHAVARGRRTGIFCEWDGPDGAHAQVYRFSGKCHEGFSTYWEAEEWLCQRTRNDWLRCRPDETDDAEMASFRGNRVRAELTQTKINVQMVTETGFVSVEQANSQDIGRWGEEFAFIRLQNKLVAANPGCRLEDTDDGVEVYDNDNQMLARIHWHNRHQESGYSYDISIIDREVETYWEVKSTITDDRRFFRITRSEWEFLQEKRDLFHILRVYRAGTKTAGIEEMPNPYKLWLEGSLIIDGVRSPVEVDLQLDEAPLVASVGGVHSYSPPFTPIEVPVQDECYEGFGRYRDSTARVRLYTDGSGTIVIYKKMGKKFRYKSGREYYSGEFLDVIRLLGLVTYKSLFVAILVEGRRIGDQAKAAQAGLIQALIALAPELRERLEQMKNENHYLIGGCSTLCASGIHQ
jgi:ribosomal protein S9